MRKMIFIDGGGNRCERKKKKLKEARKMGYR